MTDLFAISVPVNFLILLTQ